MPIEGVKTRQTVTSDFERVAPGLYGVIRKRLVPLEDERGSICEIYRASWGIRDKPMVYLYQVAIRPGMAKGWSKHSYHDDRIFVLAGTMWWALFDDRPDSPTYKQVDSFVVSEKDPCLLVIPIGVFHAVKNVGLSDAWFVNIPTEPYRHEDPDRHRLPIDTDLIPFSFDRRPKGW